MITEKYNYKSLKRKNVNGKRHYLLEGDESYTPMPSVTTILSETKPEADKAALDEWRKNVGSITADAVTMEAANRGTRLHKYLEGYCLTDELAVPGTNPYAQQSNKMAEIIIEKGMSYVTEIWGIEVPLCYPEIYAGTTDLVGLHKQDEAIIDFKQTNKPKTLERVQDYYLQLAFYGMAHNEMYGSNIQKGVILMCSKDFQYQEFVIEGLQWKKTEQKVWKRLEEYYTIISKVQ